MQFGQHNFENKLNGIGKKTIAKFGADGVRCIWEGQFKDNELHGYGRSITLWYGDMDLICEVGYFDKGRLHGYGN